MSGEENEKKKGSFYLVYYIANETLYFKFGDTSDIKTRVNSYLTHNPKLTKENFIYVELHGNTKSSSYLGTDLKTIVDEKGVKKVNDGRELFETSSLTFLDSIKSKIKNIKNNYMTKEEYEDLKK